MGIAEIVIGAIGAIAAVMAAVFGIKSHGVSKRALAKADEDVQLSTQGLEISKLALARADEDVRLSTQNIDLSNRVVELAAIAAKSADRERQRQSFIAIGAVIEKVAMSTGAARWQGFTGDEWVHDCLSLQHSLVGLEDILPACNQLAYAASRMDAESKVQLARGEVGLALKALVRP